MTPPILKCLVGFADGSVGRCFGVRHAGKLWLVPSWLKLPSEPSARPARIVRFDTLPHQALESDLYEYENIRLPIAESVFVGESPLDIEYEDHPPPNLFVDSRALTWPS